MRYDILLLIIFFLSSVLVGLLQYFKLKRECIVKKEEEIIEKFVENVVKSPTCDKNKIFSAIRLIEEKIDSLEYDIYKQNQKLKKYDESFLKYQEGEKAIKKGMEEEQKKVANELKNKLDEELKTLEVDKNLSMKDYNEKTQKIEKMASKLEEETAKIGKQTSGLSAETEQGKGVVNLLDSATANATPSQSAEIRGNISSLNIPPGIM